MKKILLTALLAVGTLGLVSISEARCGRRSCERSCPSRCEPECDVQTKIVGYKYYPCCKTEVVRGYRKCPVKETTRCCTTRRTDCCKNEMSCCIFPESQEFSELELNTAHEGRGDSKVMNVDME